MADQTDQLMLKLDAGPETDSEELADLTRQLREELLELDVETVDLVRAVKAPERAKAGDPIVLGNLLMGVITSGAALMTVISTLQSWLTLPERRNYSVALEIDGDRIEVTGMSSEEQQYLIDAWLRRHGVV